MAKQPLSGPDFRWSEGDIQWNAILIACNFDYIEYPLPGLSEQLLLETREGNALPGQILKAWAVNTSYRVYRPGLRGAGQHCCPMQAWGGKQC